METPICQIALSVSDIVRSRAWYQRLGLEPTGEMGPLTGPAPAQMLGLSDVHLKINWVAGRDPMSQLELMQFSLPVPRPLPADWSPRHAGYGIPSYIVPDFERLLHELNSVGTKHAITGPENSRSIWIRDPDRIPLEILEKDPLGSLPAAQGSAGLASIRAVSLTVADLEKAKRYWTSAVGLSACAPREYAFNDFPANLNGGVGEWEQEFLKGGPFLVRLLKPRSLMVIPSSLDRRLSDLGVLNIAAIVDGPKPFSALLERFRKGGYPLAAEAPMTINDDAGAIYGHDDQENSIELGFVLPGREGNYGWRR